jgi:hypothetical protein
LLHTAEEERFVFANQAAFNDPRSRMMATGVDLQTRNAIVDARGNVLAYAQTGGMLSPIRWELKVGEKLYRFAGADRTPQEAAKGGWWIDRHGFERLFAFAQVHELAIGMAMRLLCLVPPEWSSATLLVRARVAQELLAWRGLGNSVITKAAGGGMVSLPHQNEIEARRVHQLFIPGLAQLHVIPPALQVENAYPLDAADSMRGFIYL